MLSSATTVETPAYVEIAKETPDSIPKLYINGDYQEECEKYTSPDVSNLLLLASTICLSTSNLLYVEDIHIENCQLTDFIFSSKHFPQLTHLTLVNCGTTKFKNIHTFEYLYNLTLDNNGITEFPSQICEMKELVSISLEGNKLTCVPEKLFTMEGLSHVNFSDNKIKSLANVNKQSSTLAHIYFENNCIEEIGEINIPKDNELEIYNLVNNRLTTIPKSIDKLIYLQEFDLSGNPDIIFDSPFFENCPEINENFYTHINVM